MPLRDHFHPPLGNRRQWEQVHGQWPAMLLVRLNTVLPDGFVAGPRVRLGGLFEVDIGTIDEDGPAVRGFGPNGAAGGAPAATLTAPPPTFTADAEFLDVDEVEVEIHDETRGGTLVAVVEFVSPRNKDRPQARRAFAAKCATLLRQGVSVAVVDVVTARSANLYGDTLDELGVTDPALGAEPPVIYAASVRRWEDGAKCKLDAWAYPLDLGSPLPMLPLWLTEDLWVPLDLEGSYEDSCRVLRIR